MSSTSSEETSSELGNKVTEHSEMEFDIENPLTSHHGIHSDTFPSLFLIESDHMPSLSYSKSVKTPAGIGFSFRQDAVSSILQVCCCFDPFLSYLAVNYLDRFLSTQGMPLQKPWVVRLLRVSCVSLAVKMMNRTTEFSLNDIQGNASHGGLMFDTETIQRMEALILGALKWRMRSVTPFAFLSFFIHYFKLKDPPLKQALRTRATQTILRAQNEGKMVGFKPSLIAASALLSACHELFPLQFSCYRDAILSCSYVNKEMMEESYREMQEVAMEEYESVMDRVSSSDTPVNLQIDRQLFFCSSASSEGEEEEEAKQKNMKDGTIDDISTAAAAASSTTSTSISSCCSDGGTIGQVVAVDNIMMTEAINRNNSKRRKITTTATTTNYCNNHDDEHNNDATAAATPEISQRLSDPDIAPHHQYHYNC
ncbi:unnamed protein product [Linum trigynum]|uniref:B-like cyclin n=2 Tax=Linum trigynum TaxID=586398 RepID=A0AAV2GAL3_9ROSI